MNFKVFKDDYNYQNYVSSIILLDKNSDLTDTGYIYVYNNKSNSNLILTLPTGQKFMGINITIKNPSLTYQVLSSSSNIKQFDGTIGNLICDVDNFVNIVHDGNNWLLSMTN
jgi:hypothetical protein